MQGEVENTGSAEHTQNQTKWQTIQVVPEASRINLSGRDMGQKELPTRILYLALDLHTSPVRSLAAGAGGAFLLSVMSEFIMLDRASLENGSVLITLSNANNILGITRLCPKCLYRDGTARAIEVRSSTLVHRYIATVLNTTST